MSEFGIYIRTLRKRVGLTLREIEEQTGISNAYLSQIEQGHRNPPSPAMLKRLAKALGVSQNQLMVEAGYLEETKSADRTEDKERIESIFELVSQDPLCSFGQRAKKLSLEDKISIIRLYERAKGVKLL